MPYPRSSLTGLAVVLAVCAAACVPEEPDPSPGWTLVFEDLDPALLSVWGSSHADVWAVGADAGDGPMVLRFDGSEWTRLATGASGGLWWVSGRGSGQDDEVWLAGEGGLLLRYDRGSASFSITSTPESDVVLFGVLPVPGEAGANDVWAVGGNAVENRGVLWTYVGDEWIVDPEAAPLLIDAGMLFKIWGESSDDLFVVGANGVGLRRTADGWSTTPIPTGRRLFTVHGSGEDVVAVGGATSGLIVEWDAAQAQWVDVTPNGLPQLNGVFVESSGHATAVGIEGSIWERDAAGEAWREVPDTPPLLWDYHATYVDPDGDTWAVGGFVIAEPYNRGVLAHHGLPISATIND